MKKQREHWSSRFGFIMAAAGSAIGLGTLWMFPYLTGDNGGGLFVLVYLIAIIFLGFPIFVSELLLGRYAQRASVGIFTEFPPQLHRWKIIGWFGVAGAFLIMSYYSVVAGWGLNYILFSACGSYQGRSMEEIKGVFDILLISGDINIFWHLIFSFITMSVVYMGVRKGIEHWSRLMTVSLLIMLLGLFVYSLNLDGFSQALHFVFYPDLSKLKPSGILEALGLAFFTLSLGQGVMLTYGSYLKESDDIPQTAMIVVVMDVVVSLLAALVIFPMIFTFGFEPNSGPGLIFKVLPVTFSLLPGSSFISTIFFTLFVFTALTSSIALVEVIVANFIDLLDWSRKKSCIVVGILLFIAGIPSALSGSQGMFANWERIYGMNFFDVVNTFVSNWVLPIGGMLTATFIGWAMPRDLCFQEFLKGSSWGWLLKPWFFMIRWLAPIATLLIILHKSGLFSIDVV